MGRDKTQIVARRESRSSSNTVTTAERIARISVRFRDIVMETKFRRAMRLTELSIAQYQAWMYRELAARRVGLTRGQRHLLGTLRDAAFAHLESFCQ